MKRFSVFFSLDKKQFNMKYTFVSVPALGDKQNTYLNIKGKLAEYAQTYKFDIPEFKVKLLFTIHSVNKAVVDWYFGCSSFII